MYFEKIFLNYEFYQRYVQKLKTNWNKSGRIKVDNFRESLSLIAYC